MLADHEHTVFEEVILQAAVIIGARVPKLPQVLASCDLRELVFLLEIEHLEASARGVLHRDELPISRPPARRAGTFQATELPITVTMG